MAKVSSEKPQVSSGRAGASPGYDGFMIASGNLKFVRGQTRYPALPQGAFLLFIFVVAFSCCAVYFGWQYVQQTRILNSGKRTEATVIARHTVTGKTTTYFLTVQYQVNSNTNQFDLTVNHDIYTQDVEGTQLSVKYSLDSPDQVQLADSDANLGLPFNNIIGFVVTATLVILLLGGLVLVTTRDGAMADRGCIIYGKIMTLDIQRRGRVPYRLYIGYRFQSPQSNLSIDGKCNIPYRAYTVAPGVGSAVAILYVDDRHFRIL
jgi:hypothetical protein